MYVYNKLYRMGRMLSWLIFLEVDLHANLCKCAWQIPPHCIYQSGHKCGMTPNKWIFFWTHWVSNAYKIGDPLRWISKTKGNLIEFWHGSNLTDATFPTQIKKQSSNITCFLVYTGQIWNILTKMTIN